VGVEPDLIDGSLDFLVRFLAEFETLEAEFAEDLSILVQLNADGLDIKVDS
jgi:hypothetical protein